MFSQYIDLQIAKNLDNFLFALHQTIDKALSKFKNIVIMGDMNIDTLEHSSSLNKLTELCDTLGLQNLIKVGTCEMKGSSTCIDLILTNCKHNFKHTRAFEIGLSDFNKMVTTCFKNTYERLRPINIKCRSDKNVDRDTFLSDLQAVPFEEAHSLENSELAYEKFQMLQSEVVGKTCSYKK